MWIYFNSVELILVLFYLGRLSLVMWIYFNSVELILVLFYLGRLSLVNSSSWF